MKRSADDVEIGEGAKKKPAVVAPAGLITETRPDGETATGIVDSCVHIYMCRHGTTTWNLAKRWQGEQDTELAPQGVAQAEATAKLLASRPLVKKCERIYCSDLKRAHHTAQIYAKELGCEVVVEPRLREPSLGQFEGMTKTEIYTQFADLFESLEKLDHEKRLLEPYFEGLESPLNTSARAEAVAKDALESHRGQVVLFVSHSKVLEAVLAKVFGKFYEGVETQPCAFFQWTCSDDGNIGNILGEMHSIECNDHQVQQ